MELHQQHLIQLHDTLKDAPSALLEELENSGIQSKLLSLLQQQPLTESQKRTKKNHHHSTTHSKGKESTQKDTEKDKDKTEEKEEKVEVHFFFLKSKFKI